jgi:tetratricopeptide (TPR) repeat protein
MTLDPDYAYGHSRYGNLLMATGQVDSAIAEWRRAVELDPLDPQFNRGLALMLVAAGRSDEARAAANRAVALDEVTGQPQLVMAVVHVSRGEWDAAAEQFTMGGFPAPLIGLWRAAIDDPAKRADLMAFLDRAPGLSVRFPGPIALLLVKVGENDRAMQLLENGVHDRTNAVVNSVKVHPMWDPLRGDPRYDALLDSMGL